MKILTLFLCAVAPLMASAGCPSGWSDFNGQKCFLVVSDTKTWAQAELHCMGQGQGGHLASVHSVFEFDHIQSLTNTYSWIGGYDGGLERVWFWTDGSKFDYQNWADGEPNNGNSIGQYCLATNYGDQRRWDDGWCSAQQPFI